MLFGDADIERAVRVRLGELVDARTRRHGGGYGADLGIAVGQFGQRFAEHVLIGWRTAAGALVLFAGDDIELGDAVIFVGGIFGKAVTLAFLRHHVDENRAFLGIAHVFQHGNEMVEIVAVDRADIVKPSSSNSVPPVAMPRAYSSALDAVLCTRRDSFDAILLAIDRRPRYSLLDTARAR